MTTVTCPNGHLSTSTDYCDTCGAPMGATADGGGPDPSAASRGPVASSAGAAETGPATSAASQSCANCGVENVPDALFCEACGYDFTTGAMPRVPTPASSLDLGAPMGSGQAAGGAAPSAGGASATPSAGGAGATPDAGGAGEAVSGPGAAASTPDPAPLAPPVELEWVLEVWVDPDWHAQQDDADPCPSPGLPRIVPLTVRSVLIGRRSRSRNIHPEVDCSPDNGVSRRHAQLTTDGSRWWIEDLQSSNGTYVGPDSGPLPTTWLTPGTRQELREGDRIYLGAWTRLVVRRATAEERAGLA